MTIPYEASYLGQLRQLVGKRKLFAITARAIVRDEAGRILLVRRSDNGAWVMPAGSIELGESILDCVKREVKEEAGLDVIAATPMAIYSDPKYSIITSYGDPYQLFSVVFVVEEWRGDLVTTTDETTDARFFSLDALPEIPAIYQETLADLDNFQGLLIVK
jgi:ADP-ribose pyrophosphatase YjhB (NUDIX family)